MTAFVETERKRRLTEPAGAAHERLIAAGFVPTAAISETDTYYSRPDVDFVSTVECLRVRVRPDFAEITYKPPTTEDHRRGDGVTAKIETNVSLGEPSQGVHAERLMESLGMVPLARVEKVRRSYRHPRSAAVTVSIDVLTDVGNFVEVEVLAESDEDAVSALRDTERRLGMERCPIVEAPYRDLVMRSETP